MGERPIPLIATNLDFDTEDFLTRLVSGWADFPAEHKLIVIGGCNPLVLYVPSFVDVPSRSEASRLIHSCVCALHQRAGPEAAATVWRHRSVQDPKASW
jgi:hypothetical protein